MKKESKIVIPKGIEKPEPKPLSKKSEKKVDKLNKEKAEQKQDNKSENPESLTKYGLTLKQEKFCQLYVSYDREFFGNGTKCYLEVYSNPKKPMAYKTAMVIASQALRNPKIVKRIQGLLTKEGFNDENVDKQLLSVINQHGDLRAKIAAIREYNNLKKRVLQNPIILLPTPIYGGTAKTNTDGK